MRRREWLGRVAAAAVVPQVDATNRRATFLALAETVLPSELDASGRADVVDAFLRWIRGYRAGAEMDHGYGFTRLRRTGPSPADRYPVLLDRLDREAALHTPGASFTALPAATRRALVETWIDRLNSDSRSDQALPARPAGDPVLDLMVFYFRGSAANDLCYRAAIGRDDCRGLPGSEAQPVRLTTKR
jgi:hypothetical protein